MKKVLFVCTGNTCRSPMAQAIYSSLTDSGKFIADSCGIFADGISKITDNAKAVLAENGIYFEHISKKVSSDLLEKNDIVICMTQNHYTILTSMFPEFSDKIFIMPKDILDPYGGSIDVYRACYNEIYHSLKNIINEFKEQND